MVWRPSRCLIYPNLLSRTVRQDKQASHPPALFLPDFNIFCIFCSIYSPFLQSPNPRSSETAVSCTIIHIKDRTLLSRFNRKQQCENTDDDTEELWQISLQSRGKVFLLNQGTWKCCQVKFWYKAELEMKKNFGNKWHLPKSNRNPNSPRYWDLSTLDSKKKRDAD